MSTKSNPRKRKKRGGRRAAPASSMPKQTKDELKVPKGGKGRNWAALKERYMAYEFLTYTDMGKTLGIPEDVIQRHACVKRDQPETWRDERSRKTRELAEAQHEKAKREAAGLNAKLREQILLNADTLEAVGRNTLVTKEGGLTVVSPTDAIRAVGEASRIKQALVATDKTQAAKGALGDEEAESAAGAGLIVLPPRQDLAEWTAGQRQTLKAPAELPEAVQKKKK